MSSSSSPRKRKPGPKPMRPTKRQRHQVEVGVSIGLTVDQIATAVAIPRHTIYRHFSDELATGRAKRLLTNAVRLDAMAEAGNVSAAKFLHTLMMQQSETVEPDPWAAVVASISESNEDADNLSQNPDFGKMNGHGQPKHDLRPMRQAAMAGDHSAARALLKL